MRLAVVIPVLNEEAVVADALARLAPLRARGASLIVVDGGSSDGTVALASRGADRVLASARGRAAQMNAGARAALADRGVDVLVFLHIDTRLPDDADRAIGRACGGRTEAWGHFAVHIAGRSPALRVVAAMMNARSRLTGICTGDQCVFTTGALFERIGGFPLQPLMEDIEFARRARRIAWPNALRSRAITSGRRWDRDGIVRTVLLMWRLRLAYFFGADPERLAAAYRHAR